MLVNEISHENASKLYGYSVGPSILVPTDDIYESLKGIAEDINSDGIKEITLKKRSKKEFIGETKGFFRENFKLHRVAFKRMLNGLDFHILLRCDDIVRAAKLCNMINIKVNPFRLPITYAKHEDNETMVVANATYIDNKDFFDNIDISYRGIILDEEITDLSSSCYVHEITHTQIDKGMIRDYCNGEVIPIFMEMLSIYKSGNYSLLELSDILRLNELINHINILMLNKREDVSVTGDLVRSTVYATSILKAFHLFIEYVYGTDSLRKYIIRCIQNLFDGNLQLEEILDEFDITVDSVFEDGKLLKYLR